MELVVLLAGLVGLWFGAGLVVESAKKLAIKFKISLTLIGLTIVSIGTSLPEIFTNIFSGIKNLQGVDASGIAVGTNIGSCLTQITLILGLVALIGTMTATKKIVRRDGTMVLIAILAMFIAGINGTVSRVEGVVLVAAYIAYIIWISRDEQAISHIYNEIHATKHSHTEISIPRSLLTMAAGIGVLIVSSDWVVDSGLKLTEVLGVSQSFVGVMIIGVGTGLPELSTALRGVLKEASGISLGTLIGSNITDPMFSLGSGAIVAGFAVEKTLLWFDIPYWFFVTVLALFLISRKGRIGKKERGVGFILLAAYLLFVTLKIIFFV